MASRDPRRPNILYIISDDQGAWALGCAGNSEIKTPVLDRLAEAGIRFENFFCTSPVCSPARASVLTGEIPSRHGVQDWIRVGSMGDGRIDYLEGQRLLTDVFADNGYRCGLIGKWHLGASDRPRKNYVKWFAHQTGMGPYYDAPMVDEDQPITLPGYITEELGKLAVDFVAQEASRSEPFWLSLNFTAPHYPWIDSHPKEFTDLYQDCPFNSCPDEPPHPDFAGGAASVAKGEEQRRKSLIGYFASVTAMDAAIGEVIAEIERQGLTESTLVVFMGDNGMNCGHHGIWGKGNGTRPQNMYDTSIKVPCIIAQPSRIPSGLVRGDLLSGYDMFPTLLEHAGLAERPTHQKPGRSFGPLLAGGALPETRDVVVYDEYGPVRMVRTREWKYVHRFPDGPHELFDLVGDPDERVNRINDAGVGNVLGQMRGKLFAWFKNYVDPRRDAVSKGVTGCGQLGRPEDATPERPMFADLHLNGADWDLWLTDGNPVPHKPE
ncbi:MAG TPA: sulfatase-like hydrolase/transferase [Tianweitania sediminis]|jgi:arylsulfatase A-like enzyme|nr:sulfatase-like hydrolase/transferase [Tianweitania sediminis]